MKNYYKTIKKIVKILLITTITLIIIVIGAGMYKFNYLANKEGYDVDGNKIITEK